MVLTFIAGFAATFGAAEGIRAAQAKSRREEHRTRKNNLVVRCARGSKYSALLEGRRVVLANGKLYVDTGTEYNVPFGHPFEGYFLPYPSPPTIGLVSTITHEAPIMNWVFVHASTHELRFGPRAASEGNATGPWDCTRQDRRLTFEGWEGFCAVREGDFWALYFDRDGERLQGRVGGEVVEVGLLRVEMRVGRLVREGTEEEMVARREREEAEARAQAERAAKARTEGSEGRNAEGAGGGGDRRIPGNDSPEQEPVTPRQPESRFTPAHKQMASLQEKPEEFSDQAQDSEPARRNETTKL